MRSKKTKWYTFLLMLATVAMILGGCSSANGNMDKAASMANSGAAMPEQKLDNKAQVNTETASSSVEAPAAAAGGDADGGSIGEIAAEGTGTGMNQKLIYKGNLTIEAVDYDRAATALRNAIHQSGGYILQFQDGQYNGEKSSTYTIKVPAAGFMDFIDRLDDGIEHKQFERQISGTDVTEEYVDLQSRLKAQQVVEERLLNFMDKATKADDLVKFSEQLATVQENIERLKGRIRYLDNNVSYSTIELRLYQPDAKSGTNSVEDGLGDKMSQALNDSVDAMISVLQGLLVFVAGALPVLLLLLLIGLPIYWLRGRSRSRARNSVPAPPKIGNESPVKEEDKKDEDDPNQPNG
ncbi:DUF4349 domain-containing protein [Paenibacillus glycanilyticus]|uniref:DUF4349 domain-containing protein n=1 Tax=Paenibacillus glycanilyticus TaxID=126569 RepID=UPI002040B066|nr:DUF4349 domain-containing protein [Paenibacillus glycanilyticus]MCM3626455.1 DUF4349 domain-containing protein [Paenibacillus glycanilyticus]